VVPVGIRLSGVKDASLAVVDNKGTGFEHGVEGKTMDNKTSWDVVGNSFPGASHEVYYDKSVANKPTSNPAPPMADPGAWGPGAEPKDGMAGMHHHHG
jgi:hypothetical protein